MKINYNKFIRACTDLNHKWMTDYETDFFNCFFSWVDHIENGLTFGNIINNYVDGEFLWDRGNNHKDCILVKFTIYENGKFNVSTEIRGWQIKKKNIQIDKINTLLDINCKYIDKLYKTIYEKKLFYNEEEN